MTAVRPMGGDYSQDIFVAIEGVPLPPSNGSDEYKGFGCELTLKNEPVKLNEMGTGLPTSSLQFVFSVLPSSFLWGILLHKC